MACVRKRRGKWVIDFYDQFGKRHWETVGKNKKEAEERLAERTVEIHKGAYNPALSKTVLREYAERWLETYAKVNLKASTVKTYTESLNNHILPLMGHIPLKSIRRDMAVSLITDLVKKGLSRNSVRVVHATLRTILNSALDEGILAANPALRLGKYTSSKTERQKEINPLSREELALFLKTALTEAPAYFPLFFCLARTGLRIGEAIGLQCGDLDFSGFGIEVCRSIVNGRVETPKNGRTRRVDMSQQLAQVLRELTTKRKAQLLRLGKSADELGDVWLFQTRDRNRLDDSKVRKVFNRMLAKAGLPRLNLHSLRHTFASILIQNGESLAYVKDQLGHYSIQLTVDTYGHLAPGGNREAVDRLDDSNWRSRNSKMVAACERMLESHLTGGRAEL